MVKRETEIPTLGRWTEVAGVASTMIGTVFITGALETTPGLRGLLALPAVMSLVQIHKLWKIAKERERDAGAKHDGWIDYDNI